MPYFFPKVKTRVKKFKLIIDNITSVNELKDLKNY